jgi:hypothetical protein
MSGKESIAEAIEWGIRDAFMSECVMDSNGDPANVVDVLDEIGTSIRRLASGPEIAVAARTIAEGLHAIAASIGGLAEAIRETDAKGG